MTPEEIVRVVLTWAPEAYRLKATEALDALVTERDTLAKAAPVNSNLVPAEFEQALRDRGGPVRCCQHWPECSHMLAWYERHERNLSPHKEMNRSDVCSQSEPC